MNKTTILLFKSGYIDRCEYVKDQKYSQESFYGITDEDELKENLLNNRYPIIAFGHIIYITNTDNSNKCKILLDKLFN